MTTASLRVQPRGTLLLPPLLLTPGGLYVMSAMVKLLLTTPVNGPGKATVLPQALVLFVPPSGRCRQFQFS